MGGIRFFEKIMLKQKHDPEKHALGLDPMGGIRFSEKIMLKQKFFCRATPAAMTAGADAR
jgi:hypothetical protein